MQRMLDQATRNVWGGDVPALPGIQGSSLHLRVDESEDGYVVRADLNGYGPEDIRVAFEDGVLTVEAEIDHEATSGLGWSRHSYRLAESITFDGEVEDDEMTASLNNGVLEISVPVSREESDSGHQIDIE